MDPRCVAFALCVLGSCGGERAPDNKIIDQRLAAIAEAVKAVADAPPLTADTLQPPPVALTFEDISEEGQPWNTGVLLVSRYRSALVDPYDVPSDDRWWRWPDLARHHAVNPSKSERLDKLRDLAATQYVLVVDPVELRLPRTLGDDDAATFATFTRGFFEGEAHLISLADGASHGGFRFTARMEDRAAKFTDEPWQVWLEEAFWEDVVDAAQERAKGGSRPPLGSGGD